MRYITKFNESRNYEDELEYMKLCFVDMFDKFGKYEEDSDEFKKVRFNWSEVSDDFIPFLELLYTKYKIAFNTVSFSDYEPLRKLSEYNRLFSIEEILNGEVPYNASCKSIDIQINNEE